MLTRQSVDRLNGKSFASLHRYFSCTCLRYASCSQQRASYIALRTIASYNLCRNDKPSPHTRRLNLGTNGLGRRPSPGPRGGTCWAWRSWLRCHIYSSRRWLRHASSASTVSSQSSHSAVRLSNRCHRMNGDTIAKAGRACRSYQKQKRMKTTDVLT